MSEFIAMSGYGAYVWSCYGLTLVALLWMLLGSRRELRKQIAHAKRRLHAQSTTQDSTQ